VVSAIVAPVVARGIPVAVARVAPVLSAVPSILVAIAAVPVIGLRTLTFFQEVTIDLPDETASVVPVCDRLGASLLVSLRSGAYDWGGRGGHGRTQ
jgi:hypothetical protein